MQDEEQSQGTQHLTDSTPERRGVNKVTQKGGGVQLTLGDPEHAKRAAAAERARYEASERAEHHRPLPTRVSGTRPIAPTPAAFRVTSPSGRSLPAAEITAQSMVHIGNERVHVSLAESTGLVTRDSSGNVILTTKGAKFGGLDAKDVPAESNATNEATAPPEAHANPATEAAITKASRAMEGVPLEVMGRGIAQVLEGRVDTEGLAEQLGTNTADAADRVATITAGYQAEASSHVKTLGVQDAGKFREWAESQRTEEFKTAVAAPFHDPSSDLEESADLTVESRGEAFGPPQVAGLKGANDFAAPEDGAKRRRYPSAVRPPVAPKAQVGSHRK